MPADRSLLLARLAAERAHLLHELIGLTEADLTGPPVVDVWTAANLLAHIADWDRFFAERIEIVFDGRAMDIPSIEGPDERNPEVYERIKGLTLAGSVNALKSARAEFLAMLNRVDDPTLKAYQQVQWGRVKIRTWASWRGQHDFNHAKDIRRWKKRLAETFAAGPRVLMLAALDAARADFEATSRLIPPEEAETKPLTGAWMLADVLGHLTDWTNYFLCNLREGDPASFMGDEDTFNERKAAARKGQPLERARIEFAEVHQVLVWTLEETLDAHWMARPRPGTSPYPTVYHVAWSALEHVLDHAALIRAALGVRWPARLLHVSGPYTG